MQEQKPHQKYATSRPRKGERLRHMGKPIGVVTRIDGNICHYQTVGGGLSCFIWCFHDGINALMSWPSKPLETKRAGR